MTWRGQAMLSVLLVALLVGCQRPLPGAGHAGSGAPRVVAYVMGRAELPPISPEKLTHINYAFAKVSDAGEIHLPNPSAPAHLAQLRQLKVRSPSLKVLLAVGGWGADGFSDAALTGASRERFARSAVAMLRRHQLDGIDLDWEYPGQPGPGIKHRPEDRENFTLLLESLRRHLDALSAEQGRTGADRYLLTIASAAGDYFRHTEMDRLHAHLDWINIMTYDFYTSGSRTTGHHAALYRSDDPAAQASSADASVRQHLDAGIPPHKLVIGAAFYGRAWTGVAAGSDGMFEPYTKYAGEHAYSKLARDYIGQRGFQRRWDPVARAPYLWNPDSTTVISYEDEQSLRAKAAYVRQNRLGGVMYWEHGHDPREVLLDALSRALR